MNHDRPLLDVLLVHVVQVETLGQVEVQLHGGALPFAPDGVRDLDVDLGAVKRAAALVDVVAPPLLGERLDERALRALPNLGTAHALLRLGAEVHLKVREAELAQDVLGQVQHAQDLVRDLIGQAEDVRVVLREPAHAEQPVHRAAPLVAVHGSHLRPADGQVSIGEVPILEHGDVERAIHGLELVDLVLNLHGLVHVLAIEIGVPARLPQVQFADVRRVQQVVPARQVDVLPEVLDHVAHQRTFGVPEHQPSAHFFLLDGKQVQILPEFAVVAARRFLLERVVRLHLLGRAPGRPVDALQHRARLVAAPVRSGDGFQVDGLRVNLLRGLDVRTRAQVPPLVADVVDGDRLRLDGFQNLELVRLVDGADTALRLLAGHFLATQRVILVDDLDHLLLDGFQVLVCGVSKRGGLRSGSETRTWRCDRGIAFFSADDRGRASSRRGGLGTDVLRPGRRAAGGSDRACATRGVSAESRQ